MRDCKTDAGKWRDDVRAARACTLHQFAPGIPVVEAKPQAAALIQLRIGTAYMGRHPDRSLAGTRVLGLPQNWQAPYEDPKNGCPGAWYRTRFVDSVVRYARRRTDAGARVPNRRLERTDDWLIHDAVAHLELEEERALAHFKRLEVERLRAQPNKPPPSPRSLGRVRVPRPPRGRRRG
jgi:hypothetical protein